MTNEKQEEAGPVTVQIGVCSTCHALFLISGERLTSPCHGADPLAVLATLVVNEDGRVSGEWGMGAPIGERDITEEPAAPAEEGIRTPAVEEEQQEEGPVETALDVARSTIGLYVALDEHDAGEVRHALEAAGAEPEAVSTAVGRLQAVRDLLVQLRAPREAAPVAPAPPEAESSPENT